MIFVYKKWEEFCKKLSEQNIHSVSAQRVLTNGATAPFLVLKHDVETAVSRAYRLAEIEHSFGHIGSYYVQGYLLEDPENIALLKKMQEMGHEISYHYDVLDFAAGDMEKAKAEYERNRKVFAQNGFQVVTVCQHGNPIIERKGYTSNRDFFRNNEVSKQYSGVADIMVNFKEKVGSYDYYSDAGRSFKLIFDPETNDITNSDEKNVPFDNLDRVLENIVKTGNSAIISTHPHRWMGSAFKYRLKLVIFKVIKGMARILEKIPFFKKLMSKYYYLAKKI